MIGTTYTRSDIADARGAASRALEARGWTRSPIGGDYQPIYRNASGVLHLQLVRILDTPRFELVAIAAPTRDAAPRRLDYAVTACACGDPVVRVLLDGQPATLVPGFTGLGRVRIAPRPARPQDSPPLAVRDAAMEYGHSVHTCPATASGGIAA